VKTQNNQLIWQPNTYNVRGQVTEYLRGTNLNTEKYYNTFGLPVGERTEAGTTYLYYTNYNFDSQKGNLNSRTDYLAGKTENFIYDNLNRLTNENVYNGVQLTTSFTNKGNITQKSDIGTYTYGDAGPHAVTGLTSTTGTLMPANDQTIDYTTFNKASHIGQGGYDYFITYGPDRQRSRTILMDGISEETLLTKYYAFGDYEKEITPSGTRHLHYISGGDGLAAIYVKYSNAQDSLYFITTDHLGSIVGAINSTTGTIYRQNFDAWGRKRNPVNWSYTNIPDFPFDRGYTGHEHLKWFGLINMNGRMYDAAICRFLSPDSFVQMPDYTQNFNRYSYALNNPLIYSDPSGEFLFLIPAMMIGAFVNVTMQGWSGNAQTPGDFALAAGIGAASGAVGAGVGAGVGSVLMGGNFMAGATGSCMVNGLGFFGGAAMGGAGGGAGSFVSGAGNSWAGGSNFGDGLNDGLQAVGIGAIYGSAFGSLFTGFNAVSENRNFWSGRPQAQGRKLYSFRNGTSRTNTAATERQGYVSNRNVEYFSNFSNHSSNEKVWWGTDGTDGMYSDVYNLVGSDGSNLPNSRIIDVSRFRGPAIIETNANIGYGEWLTFEVDGKILTTITAETDIYDKIIIRMPPGSSTLTIRMHGVSPAQYGVPSSATSTYVHGWYHLFKNIK